jgi:hypothetical protein
MTRKIRSRLEKLGSQVPPQVDPLETELKLMQVFLKVCVAFYLGDPQRDESLVQAHARALGYKHSREYCEAVEARDPDYWDRVNSTNNIVMAKFGVAFKHDFIYNFDKVLEAFERMERAFPSPLRGSGMIFARPYSGGHLQPRFDIVSAVCVNPAYLRGMIRISPQSMGRREPDIGLTDAAVTRSVLRELTEKKIALDARLDAMIDKTIKRLAQIKTFKQVNNAGLKSRGSGSANF